MIEDYSMKLISEAKSIISQDRQEDMANMYVLLRYIREYILLYAVEFGNHIVNEGLRRVNEIGGDNVSKFLFRGGEWIDGGCFGDLNHTDLTPN